MTALSLYNIAQEHRAMVERLMDFQDDSQAISDTIEAESYPLEVKAQNTAYAVKTLKATVEAIKVEEKNMATRRKAIENHIMRIEEYLKTCMEVAGVLKIECAHFRIAIKKNPPSVEVFEPSLVPVEFMKTPEPPPPDVDKAAIRGAIASGKEVPGAMMVQGTRVEIK